MRFKDYSEKAITLAIYPPERGKEYTVFGLIDELGEVSEKIDQNRPDNEIVKEVGDVMWYASAMIHEFDFQDIFELFEESRDMQVIKNNAEKEVAKLALQHGAKLAGRMKKIMRDDDQKYTKKKMDEIYLILRSILRSLIILVNKMDLNFNEIFTQNLNKLFDRQDRGVLQGDGDNR